MDFDSWQIGSKNTFGRIIHHIYYKRTGRYIIYKSDGSSLVSYRSNRKEGYNERTNPFEPGLTRIQDLLDGVKKRDVYLSRVASIVKTIFDGNDDEARKMVNDTIDSIINHKVSRGRAEYLMGSISLLLVFLTVSAIFNFSGILADHSNIVLINCLLIGAMAGFLSVSMKLKQIEIDITSSYTTIHFFTGATRIVISVISAVIVYYLLESQLAFDRIVQNSNKEAVYYVFVSVAGFSERFVPNLMKRIEKSNTQNDRTD